MWGRKRCCLLRFVTSLVVGVVVVRTAVAAGVPKKQPEERCGRSNNDCSLQLGEGSECDDRTGRCTNPYRHGCLSYHHHSLHTSTQKQRENNNDDALERMQQHQSPPQRRICHSEDSPEAALRGDCRTAEIDYPEVRIHPRNWESAILVSWVLQVVLTEMGNIPATIETGRPDLNLDFYHIQPTFGFAAERVDWDGFRRASEHGNCANYYQARKTEVEPNNKTTNISSYEACMDVVPELWKGDFATVQDLVQSGHAEGLQDLGAVGVQSWYIPLRTAQHDPSMVSYLGMVGGGQEKRRRLAELFDRPTTWGFYCADVSPTYCTTPDQIAQRAPETPEEADWYFAEGLYTGHFRKTEENDCDKWPHNCTGHIVDWPCEWTSHVQAQCHHLDIGLQSSGNLRNGGYTPSQLVQIWNAANATQSHVIMLYWSPSVLMEKYAKTPYELTKVSLPPPTLHCTKNRAPSNRCAAVNQHDSKPNNATTTALPFGDPRGACDDEPYSLGKVVASSVRPMTHERAAFDSPAFHMIRDFQITELQMAQMLQRLAPEHWLREKEEGHGLAGVDARQVVCEWVMDNLEHLQALLPPTYPRVIRSTNHKLKNPVENGLLLWLNCLTILVILVSPTVGRELWLGEKLHEYQLSLVHCFVFGFFLVAVGAFLQMVWTTDVTCITVEYLIQLGYVFVLVPLGVEIKFSRIPSSAREVLPSGVTLETIVASFVMMIFLVLWTALDPPQRMSTFHLETTGDRTIVWERFHCTSRNNGWKFASLVWPLVLLLMSFSNAMHLGIFNRRKEGRLLVLITYSNFVFAVLRAVVFFIQDWLGPCRALAYESSILCVDIIATIAIYFVPKAFVHEQETQRVFSFASTVASLREASQAAAHTFRAAAGLQRVGSMRSFDATRQGSPRFSPGHERRTSVDSRGTLRRASLDHKGKNLQPQFGSMEETKDATRTEVVVEADEPAEHDESTFSLRSVESSLNKYVQKVSGGSRIMDDESGVETVVDKRSTETIATDGFVTRSSSFVLPQPTIHENHYEGNCTEVSTHPDTESSLIQESDILEELPMFVNEAEMVEEHVASNRPEDEEDLPNTEDPYSIRAVEDPAPAVVSSTRFVDEWNEDVDSAVQQQYVVWDDPV